MDLLEINNEHRDNHDRNAEHHPLQWRITVVRDFCEEAPSFLNEFQLSVNAAAMEPGG